MVRLAVLGAGRIGKIHGRNAASHPQARLISVSDPHQPSAEALAAETGARVSTIDEAIAASDVDAVLICTPTTTHADLIERAVQAGKAVFCEKPVDLSSDRIRRCLAEVGKAGKPLMIGFNRRFDPNFATLKQRILDGSVGEVELVTIISRDPAPPPVSYIESSGGLFRDMMIHDLDLARFLLAEEPVEVHAVASALVDPAIGKAGDVDTAAVLLKTASGKIAQISNSRRATYGYDQRIEVHGSKGLIRAHNVPKTTVEVATGAGFLADPVQDFFLERYAEAYRLEMTAFLDAILAGKAPNPSGEDGLKAQILADAATEAAQTGNTIKL
ncbi:inositol 2-dehydrogenase [Labrys okinawensis]|uniref:Inositol 2-dehydrogenase n=1 Tax=Labrys okinawensis TaxID=346911 RepID=A0A2S9QCM9_9HYPH|nr:inositol 2-dehydrogenase [Labrys okinawensis]PRH87091.1 inositol 2-dehydrogenase [Labrys okinawensis]